MKAICVSSTDYYDTRMRSIISFFESKNYEVKYLISDYNHFSKERYTVDYGCSKQLHVIPYKKNISLQRLASHYMFSKKVLREIKTDNPDLIYCIVPPNSLVKQLGLYKKKNPKAKLVFDIFDTWPESFPINNPSTIIRMVFKLWANLRDRYIDFADLLICVSKAEEKEFKSKTECKTEVLMPYLPIDELPDYKFNIKDGISFCYLGHVNSITDMELGLKILGGIAEKIPVCLHIIGEGQNKEAWISDLEKAGVSVKSHGVVFDAKEKKKIFQECDFGLNIPRPEIRSSMALKAIEYMRYGLPFINSGLGDNEEIVRDYHIGINLVDDDVITRILSMNGDELKKMHENSINCYRDRFLNQDYESILSEVMVLKNE